MVPVQPGTLAVELVLFALLGVMAVGLIRTRKRDTWPLLGVCGFAYAPIAAFGFSLCMMGYDDFELEVPGHLHFGVALSMLEMTAIMVAAGYRSLRWLGSGGASSS